MFAMDGVRTPVLPVPQIALKGEHNLENALAAIAIAAFAGVDARSMAQVLTRFRGVEHRLEYVGKVAGVDYYNDSKATNPRAALASMRIFPKNIVWIAGGLDRGDDFQDMAHDIDQRVKAAILIGQSAPALEMVCRQVGVPHVQRLASIEEAVLAAARHAKPGDVVLLSPACALGYV